MTPPLLSPCPSPSARQVNTEYGRAPGYDRVRGYEIGRKEFELEHLEEAFTSVNWIVRLYRVKKAGNRGGD